MINRKVFFHGEFVDEKDANVSIYDSALMFGDMVFEMTRSFNKKQFKLREHLERLYDSIRYVRIPINMTIDEMEEKVYETIALNDPLFEADDEHRIMINVTRGLLGIYENNVDVKPGTNVIIADFPLRWTVQSMAPLFTDGINAVIPSQRAIPASLLEPKVKNRSRLHYLLANIEVSNYTGDNNWALLLDTDGFIAEGTGDNFFIVKDGVIITPEPRNILRGVSRAYIFEIAAELGIPCIEKNIEVFDVMTANEAFMTGTPFCALPVTQLNFEKIGNGSIGPIYEKLMSQWSENVGLDIKSQILGWRKNILADSPTPYQFKRK